MIRQRTSPDSGCSINWRLTWHCREHQHRTRLGMYDLIAFKIKWYYIFIVQFHKLWSKLLSVHCARICLCVCVRECAYQSFRICGTLSCAVLIQKYQSGFNLSYNLRTSTKISQDRTLLPIFQWSILLDNTYNTELEHSPQLDQDMASLPSLTCWSTHSLERYQDSTWSNSCDLSWVGSYWNWPLNIWMLGILHLKCQWMSYFGFYSVFTIIDY